jgi:hypothetical protein
MRRHDNPNEGSTMKIDFSALNENLSYQRVAINYMKANITNTEREDSLMAIEILERFNDSMIALYESSEVELK